MRSTPPHPHHPLTTLLPLPPRPSSSEPHLSLTSTPPPTPSSACPPSPPSPQPQSLPNTPAALPDDTLLPVVFTCPLHATTLLISGSWDSWRARTPMYKNGPHHIALLYLPPGSYRYKFLLDNVWACTPTEKTDVDCNGNTNNVIVVTPTKPDFDADADPVLSPVSSYQDVNLRPAITASEPPLLPVHLQTVSKSGSLEKKIRVKSHVYLDHLYRKPSQEGLQSFSQTVRVGHVLVDTVFVTNQPKPPAPPPPPPLHPETEQLQQQQP